jgi:hypothetical protein
LRIVVNTISKNKLFQVKKKTIFDFPISFFYNFAQLNFLIMKNSTFRSELLVLLMLILSAAIFRIFFPIPNITPIAAIALFGATYIRRKELALLLPLVILFLTDLIIGLYSPALMFGVYGSFVLIGLIGFLLRKKISLFTVTTSSLSASIIFFIVSNFAVWAEAVWYPKTISGLLQCYTMAIPFFKYELIGTLSFTIVFFLSYHYITANSRVLAKS